MGVTRGSELHSCHGLHESHLRERNAAGRLLLRCDEAHALGAHARLACLDELAGLGDALPVRLDACGDGVVPAERLVGVHVQGTRLAGEAAEGARVVMPLVLQRAEQRFFDGAGRAVRQAGQRLGGVPLLREDAAALLQLAVHLEKW